MFSAKNITSPLYMLHKRRKDLKTLVSNVQKE